MLSSLGHALGWASDMFLVLGSVLLLGTATQKCLQVESMMS